MQAQQEDHSTLHQCVTSKAPIVSVKDFLFLLPNKWDRFQVECISSVFEDFSELETCYCTWMCGPLKCRYMWVLDEVLWSYLVLNYLLTYHYHSAILLCHCHEIASRLAHACILAVRGSCRNRKLAINHYKSRRSTCIQKGIAACRPPAQHLPPHAFSNAMMACGYKPQKSTSSWGTLLGVGEENLACDMLASDWLESSWQRQ